jgi:hypothetical protein
MQPLETGEAGNELEAIASLGEWCDGDRELLAQADALRDTHGAGGHYSCRTSDPGHATTATLGSLTSGFL